MMNWDYTGRSVLVMGIGGVSDIIAAYAMAQQIQSAHRVAWANTKRPLKMHCCR